MELVILGLKHKQTDEYLIYDVNNNQGRNPNHIKVEFGKVYKLPIISPYPFSHFSTLDEDAEYWKDYDKSYLLVDSEVSEEEYKSMKSSGVVYHRFKNRDTKIKSEFDKPLQYSLNKLEEFGEQLGTYDLTTWVIHERLISNKEFEYGKKILLAGLEDNNSRGYELDISLDDYLLPYLPMLLMKISEGYKITFGRHGRTEINKELLNNLNLSVDDILMLYNKTTGIEILKHKNLKKEINKLTGEEEDKLYIKLLDKVVIFKDTLDLLKSLGVNISKLFKLSYVNHLSQELKYLNYGEDNPYKTIEDYLNDKSIKNYKEVHNHYDYYCCYDCDGYELGEEDEEESETITIRNNRADVVIDGVERFYPYLTEEDKLVYTQIKDKEIVKLIEDSLNGVN